MNILINGANGKMGKKVFNACLDYPEVTAVCGIDRADDFSNKDFPVYDSFDKVKQKIDVIIDFSLPASLDNVLAFALKNKVNAVLCPTGYTKEDLEKIEKASKDVAIFRSANMSLGINVLINLVKKASQILSGYDIEIIEKHHNQKIDAPSGTAVMLADAVKEVLPSKYNTYGRQGNDCKRNKDEIGIHAIRGGTIVGDHDVLFAGTNETITLSHQAFDRSVFANGALKASVYINGKKNGLYNMNDLIEGR